LRLAVDVTAARNAVAAHENLIAVIGSRRVILSEESLDVGRWQLRRQNDISATKEGG
jgi:hypothetical protein